MKALHILASRLASIASLIALPFLLLSWAPQAQAVTVQAMGCCNYCTFGCCETWACYLTGGSMASVTNVQSMQDSVINSINTFGENISAQTQTQTQAMANDFSAFAKQESTTLKGLLSAWEAARYVAETTGASGTMYQACQDSANATTAAQAMQNAQAQQASLYQAQAKRNTTPVPTHKEIQNVAQAKPADLSAADIFQTDDYSSSTPAPTASNVQAYIGILTNAMPAQRLQPAEVNNKGAAQDWQAANHAQLNALTQAQNALAFVASTQALKSNTSVDSLIEKDASSRLTDPSWNGWIQQAGQAAMAKDIAKMGAVSLAQQQESLQLTEYLAALTAQDYAHRLTASPENIASPNQSTGQARAQMIAN